MQLIVYQPHQQSLKNQPLCLVCLHARQLCSSCINSRAGSAVVIDKTRISDHFFVFILFSSYPSNMKGPSALTCGNPDGIHLIIETVFELNCSVKESFRIENRFLI